MNTIVRLICFLSLVLAAPLWAAKTPKAEKNSEPWFLFDQADETVSTTLLENPLFYDAAVASSAEGLWVSWLEFQPGKGDQLWIGLRTNGNWALQKKLSSEAGDYANPTPTIDAEGKLWLTYECTNSGKWDIFVQQRQADGEFSPPERISPGEDVNIDHRVAVDPKGGLWVVWQSDVNGQFDAVAKHLPAPRREDPINISDSPQNDWAPSATVTPDGALHVAWDSYDGQSYNVLERSLAEKKLSDVRTIAGSAAFEAHAQIASDKNGKIFVAWEEDGENWGGPYRSRVLGAKNSTKMADNLGPLHRFRKLHFAELDEKKSELREREIPMPSFAQAQARTNMPAGIKNFGTYYERAQLTIDGQNRPWILYRHFYAPILGLSTETHKVTSARFYARCLLPDGWSKSFSFKDGQGDGGQRFFAAPGKNGIAVALTTGRTDRANPQNKMRGVEFAEIKLDVNAAKIPAAPKTISISRGENKNAQPAHHDRPATKVADKHYELFYGDMHRHTDISQCFAPCDGTIDDAYRYAIDAAPLDFLGITDHTHDLAMGDQLSLIWWRSRKQVNRHQLHANFIPLFSYERSRGDTDHNVFSLRDDMLRPHTYPHAEFWKELDTNTFTVPHQPFNLVLWKAKDNVHRPLLEIFQGFRNDVKESDAQAGLQGGHEVGFICASDHMSTGASFACVWSDRMDREGIFRSMQARRTFGATAKIVLAMICGDHWMGEKFSTKEMPPIKVEITLTAPVELIELINAKGEEASHLSGDGGLAKRAYVFVMNPPPGLHIYYVRVKQRDGNMAWSSPIWVTVEP